VCASTKSAIASLKGGVFFRSNASTSTGADLQSTADRRSDSGELGPRAKIPLALFFALF
jgi:hypothetical protein